MPARPRVALFQLPECHVSYAYESAAADGYACCHDDAARTKEIAAGVRCCEMSLSATVFYIPEVAR